MRELDYVLTPGRYVGLADEEDDFDIKKRFAQLKAEFEAQLNEEVRLNHGNFGEFGEGEDRWLKSRSRVKKLPSFKQINRITSP